MAPLETRLKLVVAKFSGEMSSEKLEGSLERFRDKRQLQYLTRHPQGSFQVLVGEMSQRIRRQAQREELSHAAAQGFRKAFGKACIGRFTAKGVDISCRLMAQRAVTNHRAHIGKEALKAVHGDSLLLAPGPGPRRSGA
jgi:hypothetical protein